MEEEAGVAPPNEGEGPRAIPDRDRLGTEPDSDVGGGALAEATEVKVVGRRGGTDMGWTGVPPEEEGVAWEKPDMNERLGVAEGESSVIGLRLVPGAWLLVPV